MLCQYLIVTDHIPLVDLGWQLDQIQDELWLSLASVIDQGSFVLGEQVRLFEREYARFIGVDHCIGVANGTDALELALRAGGVGPGDEVILPTNSFFATAAAVRRAGANPVLVDCLEDALICADAVQDAITDRTRAIIPVHLYGQMANMHALRALALHHDLIIVEDSAQAQGASRSGLNAGACSDAAATSFYPSKNLGAMGDAGAVTSSNSELASRILALRNYGSPQKYVHSSYGFNSRLDTIQAAVLRLKLRHLAEWNALRRRAADVYCSLLSDLSERVALPIVHDPDGHVWHLYVVRVAERDSVLQFMQAHGVEAGIHYPIPIHLQDAFRQPSHPNRGYPTAEALAMQSLSLPIFPGISGSQQERVVATLREALLSADS
jgi:dTDP-4-amino-4,6-dideoxygalactose transaminase